MQQNPSNHDGGVELRISLPGDIQVTVTAPSGSSDWAAELLGYISLFPGPSSSARSDRSFELVSSAGVSEPPSPPGNRGIETRESILRSFDPCPARHFVHSNRLCGSSSSGKDRILRAWLAGQWAGAVRAKRVGSPNRTPCIDLRPRYYAVLQAPGLVRATIFKSSAGYWGCLGSLEGSSAISQSFPSEIEARIYLESAGAEEIETAP